jgi:lipopolysaccharide/colanic/teichoic acid biosynthesis glycosyltransferase
MKRLLKLAQLIGKRLLDIFLVILASPIALPTIVFLAFLIKIEDGGPCFYRRHVVGTKDGFDAFKLRTMHVHADAVLKANSELLAEYEKNFKLRHDPRITRIGKFLRKWSLDELPQLFNVLIGQMSLIGPRMITKPELEKYGSYQKLLVSVKPGITGYWQVSGRQETTYAERVKMDIFYIQNWSLWFDIKILLKTFITVLKRKGAY